MIKSIIKTIIVIAILAMQVFTMPKDETAVKRILISNTGAHTPTIEISCVNAELVFYIKSGSTNGNGTSVHPFGTIQEAIDEAQKHNHCQTVFHLSPGSYQEHITVTLPHLKITGEASVSRALIGNTNHSAVSRPRIRGSITHTNGGLLEVQGIDIIGTGPVSIRQRGGRMSLVNAKVSAPVIDIDDINSGISVWISDGGNAVLYQPEIRLSMQQAIRVEGLGTRVWIKGGSVTQTLSAHPLILQQMKEAISEGLNKDIPVGALLIQNNASAMIEDLVINRSSNFGIHVASNAKVRIDRSSVNITRGVGGLGGSSLLVRNGAILESNNTTLSNSSSCGISVHNANAALNDGIIDTAATGACVVDIEMPSECLRCNTRYKNVGRPLDGEYPIPEPLGIGSRPEITCPTVDAVPLPDWWKPPVVRAFRFFMND